MSSTVASGPGPARPLATYVWLFGGLLSAAILVAALVPSLKLFKRRVEQVVVYASQDQVYAEPILRDFTRQTGIKVRTVFDNEAVKTVGLANRLLAESGHPQCDVFWNNEELRTRQLARRGVFRATNGWEVFGYRSRRVIINTNRLPLAQAPRSLRELTNAVWRGKVALAYPLFGTTATHLLALRQLWGVARWEAWCRALAANQPLLVDGNSVVARLVGQGEAWVGLTDSDDLAAEQRNGAPLTALPPDAETLLIPNSVGVLRGAPHGAAAQRLFLYFQRPEVVARLVGAAALEGATPQMRPSKTLTPNWPALLADLDPATAALRQIFLRE